MKDTSLPRWGLLLIGVAMLMGGLAMSGVRPQSAEAVVGAYVELHVAECPPGYAGDTIFDDCHENRFPGVTFIAKGAGGERYEVITDSKGVAFFNDFYTAGPLTIIEQVPSGEHTGYAMYCTTVEDQTSLPVTDLGNGRDAAAFELPQTVIESGTGVVCDWYFFVADAGGGQQAASRADLRVCPFP
jgi:hypothetical protein